LRRGYLRRRTFARQERALEITDPRRIAQGVGRAVRKYDHPAVELLRFDMLADGGDVGNRAPPVLEDDDVAGISQRTDGET